MSQYQEQYDALWNRIRNSDLGLQQAVGGDFEVVGHIEFQLLRLLGLKETDTVIDIGCGSGRLATQLAPWLKAPYIGTDILADLLSHAEQLSNRPDWKFIKTNGQEIPAADGFADLVTFFSVVTHISHEDTYRYLTEAKRVLKPGGTIVCSFLEFRVRNHWAIFRMDLADRCPGKILNQFLSRDAFEAFAFNLGLDIVQFIDGSDECIPIERNLVWACGIPIYQKANLGQSVCVLRKPLVPKKRNF